MAQPVASIDIISINHYTTTDIKNTFDTITTDISQRQSKAPLEYKL